VENARSANRHELEPLTEGYLRAKPPKSNKFFYKPRPPGRFVCARAGGESGRFGAAGLATNWAGQKSRCQPI